MAIERRAVIKAQDAGRWLVVKNIFGVDKGDTVELVTDADRYANLAVLEAQIPTTYWYPNQWGDETKTLFDAAYGYQIRDKFFSDSQGDPNLGVSSTPNVAGGAKSANSLDRTSVLYSNDVGCYIVVTNPGDPVTSWEVYCTTNPFYATRFDDLSKVGDWLDQTNYGNVAYGYSIMQYVFTKDPGVVITDPFVLPPLNPFKTILRAYVPYSNQEGAYLVIDNPAAPIPSMTFQYVRNPWEASRFQNLVDFKNIVDGRPDFFGTTFRAGWEVPQFFFTQDAKQPSGDCKDIWSFFQSGDKCSQLQWAGDQTSYDLFVDLAQAQCCSWEGFWKKIQSWIFNPRNFQDSECYDKWLQFQDHTQLEQCFFALWREYACC